MKSKVIAYNLDEEIMKLIDETKPERLGKSALMRRMAVTYLLNSDFQAAVHAEGRESLKEIASALEEGNA